jgi:hypothetical protein
MINAYDLTRRIYDVDLWWEPPRHRFRRWSSYDPAGNTEHDCDKYVSVSPDGKIGVVADTQESGSIVRIWAAGTHPNRPMRMYQGGSREPFLDAMLESMFDGSFDNRKNLRTGVDFSFTEVKHWPFVKPLMGDFRRAYVCRVPIPFRNGLRIDVDRLPDINAGFFYHVDCMLADDPQEVQPFDGRFSYRDFTLPHAQHVHADPLRFYGDEMLGARRVTTQGHGERVSVFQAAGAGMVRRLVLRLSGVAREDLHDLRLTIAYGNRAPSFDAPVSLLFGAAFELHAFRSRALGYEDGVFQFQLPIPYRDGVAIGLYSVSKRPFGVESEVTVLDREPPAGALLLHSYSAFDAGPTPCPFVFADIQAAQGRYVGMAFSCKPYQQEDNEIMMVDGDVVARGTGREDYFNMSWGFKEYCEPDHGCPVQSGEYPWQDLQSGHGYYSAYRLHFLENVPFRKSFKAFFEKDYDPHKVGHGWASTAFLYLDRPQPAHAISADWRHWAESPS